MNIIKRKNWLYRVGNKGPWKKIPGIYVRGQGTRPLSIGQRIAA
jgi:hypothetical protein